MFNATSRTQRDSPITESFEQNAVTEDTAMKSDDYGSDDWGDIDDQDLIAAVDQAEQLAFNSSETPQAQNRWGKNGLIFLEDDFDDLGEDEIQSAAVPKLASFTYPASPKHETQDEVYYPSLVKSMSNLVNEDSTIQKDVKGELRRESPEDFKRDGGGVVKKRRRSSKKQEPILRRTKNEENIIANKGKRKFSEQDKDGEPRQKIEYTGTIFPRLTTAFEEDLADAVAVSEFSLRLMQILTSALREFLKTHIDSYPQRLRQDTANNINKMVRQQKADDAFHGWDFLALANLIIYQRSYLPLSIRNPKEIVERLMVLKTTMRWTIAHTSLEEQERKHPIELSLWAINSLLLIENLGVPMSYAARVIALHQRLWSHPPESSSESMSISEGSSAEN